MSENRPRLSIGVPVFNGADYLEEAIDSALSQNFEDFELLIADNASTDDTGNLSRRLAERDPRVRFFPSERNVGASRNFTRLVDLASGEYFMWFAYDDVLTPDYVGRCIDVLDRDAHLVLCYSKIMDIDERGRDLGEKDPGVEASAAEPHLRFRELVRLDYTCEPLFGVIRRDVLRRTARFGNYADADRVLLAELGLYGRFHRIPEFLFRHREHSERTIRQYPTRQQRSISYNPGRRLKIVLPHFREFFELVRAVERAPLGRAERLRCHRVLLRFARDHRARFRADAAIAAKQILGGRWTEL